MSTLGNITLNLHTVDRDETIYARTGNSVSHKDTVTLRRTLAANSNAQLRTNILFERGFATPATATTGLERDAKLSIAMSVPPGADPATVKAWITEGLTQAATAAANLSIDGDIHLNG